MGSNKNLSKTRTKENSKKIHQQRKQQMKKQKTTRKRIKIKYKKVFVFIIFIILIALFIKFIYSIPIRNIIIKGNYYLTEQEIIDIVGIREYPSTLANSSYELQQKLEKTDFIESAVVVKKQFLTKVIIAIDENRPLFYYQTFNKTVLENGVMIDTEFTVPILINQVPDTVYKELIKDMKGVPLSVLDKMSEIKYVPNDVDSELFLITMNDGIYVYVPLSKFDRIYNYIEYAEGFDQKKGILHLDSGDYLEILEEI